MPEPTVGIIYHFSERHPPEMVEGYINKLKIQEGFPDGIFFGNYENNDDLADSSGILKFIDR
ncbi:MAG: hypothetical protein GOV00_03605, partial [Candidatus Altiarchaeota archaeon]|nr:hypothetical protein [Candidatus Altiarchaeota archaeon]